ncbi:hypothetical protein ATEIFO6365_0015021400 [Aspergillus terreus]|uniref:NB-ARC domain-containing protein n=1 Tax=Aspergillus terreus TaxID=33178 RepID=A0A8H3RFL0_ASPTE|nr:hypothetical protein ATEIFO6365_0015021400 [Aspergillus terreus]
MQKHVLEPSGIPYEIASIKPTLGQLYEFTRIFETQLAPGLQADFFWGITGVLLKRTAQDPQALSKVPRMLKSLGYKVEAFMAYYVACRDKPEKMKEACFDIQIQLVEFFTTAVKSLRGEEDTSHDRRGERYLHERQEDPWLLLQRRFTSTNQELVETVARVEKLIATRPSGGDHYTSLDTTTVTPLSRSLWGLGGTGKSSIAARYIEKKIEEDEYDVVFWVYGEKTASLRQSFTDIAMRLKLPGAQPNLHSENLILVQNWFQSTDCRWLVVYDNVESADILMPYWPEASHGKAIITTRNHSLAYEPATSGLEIASWDAQTGSEFLLFQLKRNIGSDIQAEGDSAIELSRKLGGHALAISHMAGLIHRRSWSIAEFMRIYSKNPRRAHQSELQAVWDLSFATLGQDSREFLGIASFLVPENIPQLLFDVEEDSDLPEDLAFVPTSSEPLLTLALIKRDKDARVFSCHRMVQTQFRYFLSLDERQQAFANATALVHRAFPKQSDGTNQNQLYQEWTQCNSFLQHVLSLVDKFKEERKAAKNFKASSLFCDLLKDCQRYLYEINALRDLEDVCEVNMLAVEALEDKEKAIDIAAWTLSLQASMDESTGKVQKAIELNTKGYRMRLEEKPLKGGLLGGFEQNLAYNYNTANDHEMALTWFEKSRDTWIAWNVKEGRGAVWPTVTKKNTARCLVYLGQYDKAQELLDIAITEFKQEKPLNWAMLAYKHLRESLEITKYHVDMMPVEHARGLFKLSEALLQDSYNNDDQARALRDEAELYLLRRDPQAVEFGKEEAYDQWVPIFWR